MKDVAKARIKLQELSIFEDVEIDSNDQVSRNGKKYDVTQLKWDVPITGTVYGTLLNYHGALEAMKAQLNESPYNEPPKAPILYIKPKNTFSSFSNPIPLPKDIERLEVGAALGIVIGKTATRVSEAEALEYVGGYTIVNDISIPHESVYRPAIRYKARDGFCPIGPWVVHADSISNPDSLGIRVYINEEIVQENTTSHLIRPVSRLIADVTDFMTLNPGDVLLVGVPENAPLAKDGDKIRIEIDQIGYLENTIIHEESLALEEIK